MFDHLILLPKYFENVLNRENKFVPNIQTLLIRENIFSTICLKNSSEKYIFPRKKLQPITEYLKQTLVFM